LTTENFEAGCAVDGEMAKIKPAESVRRMPEVKFGVVYRNEL
jgi:hypothetical protein